MIAFDRLLSEELLTLTNAVVAELAAAETAEPLPITGYDDEMAYGMAVLELLLAADTVLTTDKLALDGAILGELCMLTTIVAVAEIAGTAAEELLSIAGMKEDNEVMSGAAVVEFLSAVLTADMVAFDDVVSV